VCFCVALYVWVIGSSYVFHLNRYWGEWQAVKLKLHPLSEHHNPHLCSSFSKCWFAHQNPNVCKCSCMSVCVCVLEAVMVFSPSIRKQYIFEIWQLQIAHIMTAHGWLELQSHKLNTTPLPFSSLLSFPNLSPSSASLFHIYLFISYWRGKGWIGVILLPA